MMRARRGAPRQRKLQNFQMPSLHRPVTLHGEGGKADRQLQRRSSSGEAYPPNSRRPRRRPGEGGGGGGGEASIEAGWSRGPGLGPAVSERLWTCWPSRSRRVRPGPSSSPLSSAAPGRTSASFCSHSRSRLSCLPWTILTPRRIRTSCEDAPGWLAFTFFASSLATEAVTF